MFVNSSEWHSGGCQPFGRLYRLFYFWDYATNVLKWKSHSWSMAPYFKKKNNIKFSLRIKIFDRGCLYLPVENGMGIHFGGAGVQLQNIGTSHIPIKLNVWPFPYSSSGITYCLISTRRTFAKQAEIRPIISPTQIDMPMHCNCIPATHGGFSKINFHSY